MLTLIAALTLGQQCVLRPNYVQTYARPNNYVQAQTYAAQAVVDKVLFVAVEPYYAGLVGQGARQAAQAAAGTDQLAAQVGAVAAAVSKLEQTVSTALNGTPAPPAPAPAPTHPTPPAPVPPPPAPGNTSPVPPLPPSEITLATWQLFKTDCAACHTLPKKPKNFALFNADGTQISLEPRDKLRAWLQVQAGLMPQPSPLPAAKVSTIAAWVAEDPDAISLFLNGASK